MNQSPGKKFGSWLYMIFPLARIRDSSRHIDTRPLLLWTAGSKSKRISPCDEDNIRRLESAVSGSADGKAKPEGTCVERLEETALTRAASNYQRTRPPPPVVPPPVPTFPTVPAIVCAPCPRLGARAAPLLGLLKTPCPSLPNLRPLTLFFFFFRIIVRECSPAGDWMTVANPCAPADWASLNPVRLFA